MGYTTGQFIAFIRRTITDNTTRLNTAAVVRSVLERLGLDYFNKESDTLPIGSVSGLSSALSNKADLVGGKVPAAQLPSYVDDVVDDFATLADLPQPGEGGKIYVTTADEKQYRWTGSLYILVGGGANSGPAYTDDEARDAALGNVLTTATIGATYNANGHLLSVIVREQSLGLEHIRPNQLVAVGITPDALNKLSTANNWTGRDYSGPAFLAPVLAHTVAHDSNYLYTFPFDNLPIRTARV